MSKFERFDNFAQIQQPEDKGIHPIWRGIGCLLLILIPIIAFAAADTFYDNASDLNLFGSTIFPRTGIMYRVFFSFTLFDHRQWNKRFPALTGHVPVKLLPGLRRFVPLTFWSGL